MIFTDKSITGVEREGEYPLVVRSVAIARDGVMQYAESEIKDGGDPLKVVDVFRDGKELRRLIPFIIGLKVVDGHPNFDSIDGSDEFGRIVGASYDSGVLYADIRLIKPTARRELSLGYEADLTLRDGVLKQENIKLNHLGLVDVSRCGTICKLNKDRIMATLKIKDKAYEVDSAVVSEMDSLKGQNEALSQKTKQAFKDGQSFAVEQSKVKDLAKTFNIPFADSDTVEQVKRKIAEKSGTNIEGKSMDFIDGVLQSIEKTTPVSVTSKEFDYSGLTMGGE